MNTKIQLTRAEVEGKYINARRNLLLMMAFTVINVIVLSVGSDTMLLFSATLPYMAAIFAPEFGVPVIAALLIGLAFIVPYLLCWIFSKKRWGWMIVALILFAFDTLLMIGMYLLVGGLADGIFDIVIHIWVLYYLIIGVRYGAKLKKMPIEEIEVSYNEVNTEEVAQGDNE